MYCFLTLQFFFATLWFSPFVFGSRPALFEFVLLKHHLHFLNTTPWFSADFLSPFLHPDSSLLPCYFFVASLCILLVSKFQSWSLLETFLLSPDLRHHLYENCCCLPGDNRLICCNEHHPRRKPINAGRPCLSSWQGVARWGLCLVDDDNYKK